MVLLFSADCDDDTQAQLSGKGLREVQICLLWGYLGYSKEYSRYLEGTCAQDSGPLVLGHVGGGDPLLVSRLPLS